MFKEKLDDILLTCSLIISLFVTFWVINLENMNKEMKLVFLYAVLYIITSFIDSHFEKKKKLQNKKEEKKLKNEELTVTLHKDFKEKEVNN